MLCPKQKILNEIPQTYSDKFICPVYNNYTGLFFVNAILFLHQTASERSTGAIRWTAAVSYSFCHNGLYLCIAKWLASHYIATRLYYARKK